MATNIEINDYFLLSTTGQIKTADGIDQGPQIVLHAYGIDAFGKDVIRGYGAVHIPTESGIHKRKIAMFVPQSSSILMQFNAWISGKRPEFINPFVIANGEGRGVTKVQTQGYVDITFNVALQNLTNLGYTNAKNKEDLSEEFVSSIYKESI